jgi:CubicO group peptidase (beta-lactamase class C family)
MLALLGNIAQDPCMSLFDTPPPIAARIAPTLAVLAGLLFTPACDPEELDDDDETPEVRWETLPDELAEIFAEEMDGFGASGAAIAIRHGDDHYARGFGETDPDGGSDVAPTTLFRIGSITKTLTAAALLQQVDSGLLGLEDPAVDWLDLQLRGHRSFDDVQVGQLLDHTAGLYELTPLTGGGDDQLLAEYTAGTFQDVAYLMSPPGEFWNYSNSNFSLAGLIVEEVAGAPYRRALRDGLLADLKMDRTMFLAEEVLDDGDYAVAWGRGWEAGEPGPLRIEPDSYDDAFLRPAGLAWSNVLDLVSLGDFMLHGDEGVLGDDVHREFIGSQTPTREFLDYLDYGYGVMLWSETAAGTDWYPIGTREHNGLVPGYSGYLVTAPAADLVVAILTASDFSFYPRTLGAVWEQLASVEAEPLPDLEVDPADFERYAGTYDDSVGGYGTMEVSVGDDGGLDIQMPAMDEAFIAYTGDLTPTSRGKFRFTIRGVPVDTVFLPASGGDEDAIHWLRTRYFVGERTTGDREARGGPALDPTSVPTAPPLVGGHRPL